MTMSLPLKKMRGTQYSQIKPRHRQQAATNNVATVEME